MAREHRLVHSLYLNVAEAKHLPAVDRGGTSDPYCLVSGFGTGDIVRTPTVWKELNPFWGSEWTFDISSSAKVLNFIVFDENKKSADVPIGKFSIPLAALASGAMRESWYSLLPVESKDEEFVSGLLEVEVTRRPFSLTVRLLRGKGLASKDSNGLSDPYVRVVFHDVQYKSDTKLKTLDPVYEELFEFPVEGYDAMAVDELHLVIFDWDKLSSDDFMGSVSIDVADLPLNTAVRQWYDVDSANPLMKSKAAGTPGAAAAKALGSVRVKAQYTTEVVLDEGAYDGMMALLSEPGFELVTAVGAVTKEREPLAVCLVHSMAARGCVLGLLMGLNVGEITATDNPNIIFRGNSLATKANDAFLKLLGQDYLLDTIGALVEAIYAATINYEVDPSRLENPADLPQNWLHLQALVAAAFRSVFGSTDYCPAAFKHVFTGLVQTVRSHFPTDTTVPYTVVTAFLFLRFFCPAILGPKLFNVAEEHPNLTQARSLTLVAKTLQNLANLVEFGPKEPFMHDMNPLIVANLDPMRAMLTALSSEQITPAATAALELDVCGDVLSMKGFDYCREMARLQVRVKATLPALEELVAAGTASPSLAGSVTRLHAVIADIDDRITAMVAGLGSAEIEAAAATVAIEGVRRMSKLNRADAAAAASAAGRTGKTAVEQDDAGEDSDARPMVVTATPVREHAAVVHDSGPSSGGNGGGGGSSSNTGEVAAAAVVGTSAAAAAAALVASRTRGPAMVDGFDDLVRELTEEPAGGAAAAAAADAGDESDEELNRALGRGPGGGGGGDFAWQQSSLRPAAGGTVSLDDMPGYAYDMVDELSARLLARQRAAGPFGSAGYAGQGAQAPARATFGLTLIGIEAPRATTMPASFFDYTGGGAAAVAAPTRSLDADGFEIPRESVQASAAMRSGLKPAVFKGMNTAMVELWADIKSGLPTEERAVTRSYSDCFTGRALVDFLMVLAKAGERATGVRLAEDMEARRLVRMVSGPPGAAGFVDGHAYYQLTSQAADGMPRGMAVLLEQVRLNVRRERKDVRVVHADAFLGAELVTFIITVICKIKPVRAHAVRIAEELMARNLIAPVMAETSKFEDGYTFFHYVVAPVTPDRPQNALETAAEVAYFKGDDTKLSVKEKLGAASSALVAWANAEFAASQSHAGQKITDPEYDLRSGVYLCDLLQLLRPSLHLAAVVKRHPNTRAEELGNVSLVVRELQRLGIADFTDGELTDSFSGMAIGINEGELVCVVVLLHQLRKLKAGQ